MCAWPDRDRRGARCAEAGASSSGRRATRAAPAAPATSCGSTRSMHPLEPVPDARRAASTPRAAPSSARPARRGPAAAPTPRRPAARRRRTCSTYCGSVPAVARSPYGVGTNPKLLAMFGLPAASTNTSIVGPLRPRHRLVERRDALDRRPVRRARRDPRPGTRGSSLLKPRSITSSTAVPAAGQPLGHRTGHVEPGGAPRSAPGQTRRDRLVRLADRVAERHRFTGCRPRRQVERHPVAVDRRDDPLGHEPVDPRLGEQGVAVHVLLFPYVCGVSP